MRQKRMQWRRVKFAPYLLRIDKNKIKQLTSGGMS